jgi:hypothetical protein
MTFKSPPKQKTQSLRAADKVAFKISELAVLLSVESASKILRETREGAVNGIK